VGGVGYESTDDLRDDLSVGVGVVVDGGDGGAPGPNDGIVVGMLPVFGLDPNPSELCLEFLECAGLGVELPFTRTAWDHWAHG